MTDPSSSGESFDQPTLDASPHAPGITPSHRVVYCTSCGIQLEGLNVGSPCPSCGVPVGSGQGSVNKSSGKAIAALVLGICSIVGCWFYSLPGVVCGILAIIIAQQASRDIDDQGAPPSAHGMANAGRICGIIGLSMSILCALLIVGFIVFFVWFVPQNTQNYQNPPSQVIPAQPPLTPPPAPSP